MRVAFPLLMIVFCTTSSVVHSAENDAAELKLFQGRWNIVQLVENGRVLSEEQIKSELPSGGQVEIIENTIIFQSPVDGKKSAKTFSVTATQYPKTISIFSQQILDGFGVYKFDDNRLVICISHSTSEERPTEFSAPEGSQRMLMVLKKGESKKPVPATVSQTNPVPIPARQPSVAAKVISDAQVVALLHGTWRHTDSIGGLFVTFDPNGFFRTVREVEERNVFHKVFVETPVSSGRWKVQNGKLIFTVLSSLHREAVNKEFDFTIRSISTTDFIFVDYLGHTGRSIRVR